MFTLTGTIKLQKKENLNETRIIAKLDELKLTNTLSLKHPPNEKDVAVIITAPKKDTSIFQPRTQQKDVAVIVSVLKKDTHALPPTLPRNNVAVNSPGLKKESKTSVVMIEKDENLIDINQDTIDYKVDVVEPDVTSKNKNKSDAKMPAAAVKKTESTQKPVKQTVIIPEANKPYVLQPRKETAILPKKEEKKPEAVPREKTIAVVPTPIRVDIKPEPQKPVVAAAVIKPVITVQKEIPKDQVLKPITKTLQNPVLSSASGISPEELSRRKIETIRSVDFKSDSIVLTLYDNGVIDGDTVSILLNGKVIMSKQRLTEKASTKTIYITPEMGDSLQLIMYAENLGSIAPNTGLLIIKDGEDTYQIRFAGDLQKNSAIILTRKFKSQLSQ